MKKSLLLKIRQKVSISLCMMLIVATACMTSGCNNKAAQETSSTVATEQDTSVEYSNDVVTEQDTTVESTVLGEGETKFTLTVVDQERIQTQFEIHTDKKSVGEALLDCGLVEGDDGEYGLYIKKVNGIEADYDKDGVYWAFYINGEYATSSVDSTDITEGAVYSLKVEK